MYAKDHFTYRLYIDGLPSATVKSKRAHKSNSKDAGKNKDFVLNYHEGIPISTLVKGPGP